MNDEEQIIKIKSVNTLKSYEWNNSVIEVGKIYIRKRDRNLCVLTSIQVVNYEHHTAYNILYTPLNTCEECCLPFSLFTKYWRPVIDLDIQRLGE